MATNTKITKKDNYNTLYDLVSNAGLDTETEDRLHAFIDHELELMTQRAEKSKRYQQEHKATADAMTDLIMDTLANSPCALSVSDIVSKITDSTPQKVVYRLGTLFKAEKIVKDTQTVKTEDGHTRRITYYTLPAITA